MSQENAVSQDSNDRPPKATSARDAHLIARDDRVWIVEPHVISHVPGETKARFQLREVIEPKAEMRRIAEKAKSGVILGDFEFKPLRGNAVSLISSKTMNGLDNADDLSVRALALARIDVQLSREKQLGAEVGVGFTRAKPTVAVEGFASPAKGPAAAPVVEAVQAMAQASTGR